MALSESPSIDIGLFTGENRRYTRNKKKILELLLNVHVPDLNLSDRMEFSRVCDSIFNFRGASNISRTSFMPYRIKVDSAIQFFAPFKFPRMAY